MKLTLIKVLKTNIKKFKLHHKNVVIGHIWTKRIDSKLKISFLSVTEKFQNKKFGQLLLKKISGFAIINQYESITLDVHKENKNAIALYKKTGFKITKLSSDYYGDFFEMEKELTLKKEKEKNH